MVPALPVGRLPVIRLAREPGGAVRAADGEHVYTFTADGMVTRHAEHRGGKPRVLMGPTPVFVGWRAKPRPKPEAGF